MYRALRELEKQAEEEYISARKHHPAGAEWDKGYWEGIKVAIERAIQSETDAG